MEPAPPPPVATRPTITTTTVESSPSPSPSGPKLRLMISYGGHIVPRPLDKTLFYAGGETRIVAIDRRGAYSLSTLTSHLSKSLQNVRPFVLKYQLPNHDLDSLISISTDEDLANMIDEYDRFSSISSPTPSRIRFFLFPSPGFHNDLHDPKSEDWFIDALRNVGVVAGKGVERQGESEGKLGGGGGTLVDSGGSLPESIVLEKSPSFGSTSSSASASNSPAVRSGGGEEGVGVHQDFKVSLPLADSIGSDCSIASPSFCPQGIFYQDASVFSDSKVVSANVVETESNSSDRSPRGDLLTPVQVLAYMISKPMDQQQQQTSTRPPPATPPPHQAQYIHPTLQPHYVAQYYARSTPAASYPAMYQPYMPTQQPVQCQVNKPYPVYMMPVGQAQNPYDMTMPSTLVTAPAVTPGQPQLSSNPAMVASPMVYEGYKPTTPAPESAAKAYRTPLVTGQPVTLSSDDHHHGQVVAFSPVAQSSQSVSVPPVENSNYITEYEDPIHAQIYKTQPPGPILPSQLQLTNAAAVMLSDTFSQLQLENSKH